MNSYYPEHVQEEMNKRGVESCLTEAWVNGKQVYPSHEQRFKKSIAETSTQIKDWLIHFFMKFCIVSMVIIFVFGIMYFLFNLKSKYLY